MHIIQPPADTDRAAVRAAQKQDCEPAPAPALYSVIVPVYNRPDEMAELLDSLAQQKGGVAFEILIVEDAAAAPCDKTAAAYADRLAVRYFNVPGTDRSYRRNYGMQQARGDYFIFFDSDCVIPPHYFASLDGRLRAHYSDCFGGPDAAHESFNRVQKAINYAMTSFFTTGGIRGGGRQMEKFKPRTFNMGFSRAVFETVGGFRDMFGEDIDLSIRIARAGFRTALFREAFVYHKRRVSFKKFFKQIYHFGIARVNLGIIHKGSLKAVHTFPACCLLGGAAIAALAVGFSYWWLALPAAYVLLLYCDALYKTGSPATAALAVWASGIQIVAYGWGFLQSFVQKAVFRRGMEDSETLKRIYS
ncbi:MAG: glycosyltransferase [Prevotellaceae bacterium]|jgi:glycosyltransferase involved in cell wall biosynthesis|nr:glycosyltransferase [Prevotellaceae bacterium]